MKIFTAAQEKLLLTSTKPHYLFNLLDIWEILLGVFLTIEHVMLGVKALEEPWCRTSPWPSL